MVILQLSSLGTLVTTGEGRQLLAKAQTGIQLTMLQDGQMNNGDLREEMIARAVCLSGKPT